MRRLHSIPMADQEDGGTLASWEDLADTGVLDNRFEKLGLEPLPPPNGMQEVKSPAPMIIINTDEVRSRYAPEPAVKILQRPNQNGIVNPLTNGDVKPKLPTKTLQQRELEYAEARLRILGEARSPQEPEYPPPPPPPTAAEERPMKPPVKCDGPSKVGSSGILRLPRGPDGTKGFNFKR